MFGPFSMLTIINTAAGKLRRCGAVVITPWVWTWAWQLEDFYLAFYSSNGSSLPELLYCRYPHVAWGTSLYHSFYAIIITPKNKDGLLTRLHRTNGLVIVKSCYELWVCMCTMTMPFFGVIVVYFCLAVHILEANDQVGKEHFECWVLV